MTLRSVRGAAKVLWPLVLALLFCEYLVYYPVLWRCQYPQLRGQGVGEREEGEEKEEALKVMFLADTHLLGSRTGHWWDKLRREWQMRRAFQTARRLFSPELVVFLGDLFDEGKWCGPQEFSGYLSRFEELFAVDPGRTDVRVVAGNHDVGFHYAVTPYLSSRFERAFGAPPVDLFSYKGVTFVAVNSVAMEGDKCFLCEDAKKRLKEVSERLDCLRKDGGDCEVDYDFMGNEDEGLGAGAGAGADDAGGSGFADRPILLQHYPLYRDSDAECIGEEEADWAPAEERRSKFRPGWECVSKDSSRLLLETLKPRAVLSGHTHHGCKMEHDPGAVPEWSVSSFSWRNRNNPTFLLASITTRDFAVEKCYLPQESTVINLYWLVAVVYLVMIFRRKCLHRRR